MDNLFAGENGFHWFIGVVENNADPFGAGRVQIRIMGHHNLDTDQIPTEALPWAIVLQSTDNPIIAGTGTNKILPRGCRVIGFFIDGASKQSPAIFATISGEQKSYDLSNIPPHATVQQPNVNPLVGQTVVHETECVSGVLETNTTVNNFIADYRDMTFTKSNFVYPCTGYVRDIFGSRNGKHKGVDIGALGIQTDAGSSHLSGRYRGKVGNTIYAIADGTVFHIFKHSQGQGGVSTTYDTNGQGSRSFGNCIVLRHEVDNKVILSVYAHLGTNQDAGKDSDESGILVKLGDKVTKGQQIGTMGRTHNYDTPTHLHFELRLGENLGRGYNNLIPPHVIFPKLFAKDQSILNFVETTLDYKTIPTISDEDLPIQALEVPQ